MPGDINTNHLKEDGDQKNDASIFKTIILQNGLRIGSNQINLLIDKKAQKADLRIGGEDVDGRILFFSKQNANSGEQSEATVEISAKYGSIILSKIEPDSVLTKDSLWMDARNAILNMGSNGTSGTINLYNHDSQQFGGTPSVMLRAIDGLKMLRSIGRKNISVEIDSMHGGLSLFNEDAQVTSSLSSYGLFATGGNGIDGNILLYPSSVKNSDGADKSTIQLAGSAGSIILSKPDGKNNSKDTIYLSGSNGMIQMGGNNQDGIIFLYNKKSQQFGSSNGGPTITIDGGSGDIILNNADCAEDFEVANDQIIEPGMVLFFDDDGILHPCEQAYDRRVAGVVAGAGDCRPGLVLGRQPGSNNKQPISLTGKTFCRVDSSNGPIRVGDLLTTSDKKGYAMKATDPARAFGAVIGKALRSLENGIGLIPILVSLQ